jgi:GNAT superfamily N-acetyltransferase
MRQHRCHRFLKPGTSSDLILRYATADDNLLLAELGAHTFYDTFVTDNTPENMAAYLAASFSPQKQAAELAEPGSVFLIAEIGAVVVGFAHLKEGPPPEGIPGEHPIEIVRIYACKEWIGKGVGALLMQGCLDEAVKRGCDTVWLDVWERNSRSLAFYRKWGFAEVGTQTFQLDDDLQHDLLLQRPSRQL